jgi:mRNA interferase MazF
VLVISHDVFNARSGTAIVLALTSQPQRAGYPLTLPVASVHLPKPSRVKISQIRTLSSERLGKRAGVLSPEELNRLIEGLFELVG